MNAVSRVFEADMGHPKDPVEVLAAYLKALAQSGRGMTSNNHSIASVLGFSTATVRSAKQALVRARRLCGAWQAWQSIDGVQFGKHVDNDVEIVKTALRRKFGPVYDARTEHDPSRVAAGKPETLVVGGRLMTWDKACDLARKETKL